MPERKPQEKLEAFQIEPPHVPPCPYCGGPSRVLRSGIDEIMYTGRVRTQYRTCLNDKCNKRWNTFFPV
jgi:hypothetical protein